MMKIPTYLVLSLIITVFFASCGSPKSQDEYELVSESQAEYEDMFVKPRKYGPDDNHGTFAENWSASIKMPANSKMRINVTFAALHENAVVIYNVFKTNRLWTVKNYVDHVEKREYETTLFNVSEYNREIIVSAWHKKSKPDATKPWHQSSMLIREDDPFKYLRVGFNDVHGSKWDNAIVICNIAAFETEDDNYRPGRRPPLKLKDLSEK